MIYFDSAATSHPKPACVGEAIAHCLQHQSGNPGRSGHPLARAAQSAIDRGRHTVAELINAEHDKHVAFTLSATDALNLAIQGVVGGAVGGADSSRNQSDKPHVITTVLEHNAVRRPLMHLQEAGQIDVTVMPCDAQGFVAPASIADAWTDATTLVALTHASNVLGTIQDIAAVGQLVRERGGLMLLDACQTLGVLPVDVRSMGVDLLAASGHKAMQGPGGVGCLYVGPRVDVARFHITRSGGTGGDSRSPTQPRELPIMLEAGTPNTPGIAGLTAAIASRDAEQRSADLQHERALLKQFRDALADDERFALHGCPDGSRCVGTVSFTVRGYEPQDVATILDASFGMAVRGGLHCSPWVHEHLGTLERGGSVRVSFGPSNTADEVQQLIAALEQIADAAA